MNFLTRFGDRHDRKEKKMAPDRSQSVDQTMTTTSAPLSPRDSHPSAGRPRRPMDNPCASPTKSNSLAGSPPTNDANWVVAEEGEEDFDDDSNEATSSHLHGGKRRTVSISRSGRYKTKSKERSRILSDDVYSGTTPASAAATSSSSSPSPTKTMTKTSLSLAQPVPPLQPKVQPKKKKDLVKPSSRDKSPARPYIILKSDSSVNFAIESTTL